MAEHLFELDARLAERLHRLGRIGHGEVVRGNRVRHGGAGIRPAHDHARKAGADVRKHGFAAQGVARYDVAVRRVLRRVRRDEDIGDELVRLRLQKFRDEPVELLEFGHLLDGYGALQDVLQIVDLAFHGGKPVRGRFRRRAGSAASAGSFARMISAM